jgi:hypothetical protein
VKLYLIQFSLHEILQGVDLLPPEEWSFQRSAKRDGKGSLAISTITTSPWHGGISLKIGSEGSEGFGRA